MEYKIFEVTYNNGGWHSGPFPHFYYIARSEEEVKENSKEYQKFLEWQSRSGGHLWISQVYFPDYPGDWENLGDFDILIGIRKREEVYGNVLRT